jgi:hypothetical protein
LGHLTWYLSGVFGDIIRKLQAHYERVHAEVLAIFLESNSQSCYHKPMKSRMVRHTRRQPLTAGQVWRMRDAHLSVQSVGKLLVHYRLGAPNAKRLSTSCEGIKTIEKYLKTNKAVLAKAAGKKRL